MPNQRRTPTKSSTTKSYNDDKNRTHDEDEDEDLKKLLRDVEGGNSNGHTIIIKDAVSNGEATTTVWKAVALVLAALLALLATDIIEIRVANTTGFVNGHFDLKREADNSKIEKENDIDQDTKMASVTLDTSKSSSTKDSPIIAKTDDDNESSAARYSYKRRSQSMTDGDRAKMTEKWGSWTLVDEKKETRPKHDFYQQYPNRDIPRDKFPSNAWQLDKEYVSKFLTEGKNLLMRAMEVILAEYGHGKDDENGSFEERSEMFDLEMYDEMADRSFLKDAGNAKGGWTTKRSWEGLKRRLLHAIMTEDSFNFGMGGHSSAAGHGNHFSQSYTLQVQWIMEPIFARLGVKHQSRNFGNGGLGTLHNAIAAGSIYGPDLSLLMWDSGMTERGNDFENVFARQGLLGGIKVPVLWHLRPSVTSNLHDDADVDIGYMGTSMFGIPKSASQDDIDKTPWAAKYINCDTEIQESLCKPNYYNGTCWIDRDDVTPETPQDDQPGGRASWHPGNRFHQLNGRTLAFTLLKALYEVLDEWSRADGQLLPDDAWHVTAYYGNIRNKVSNLEPSESGGCYHLEKNGFGFLCKVAFKGRTEFTPRAYPALSSIRRLMPPEMAKFSPEVEPTVYNGPDVFNPVLHPPQGAVDVLSIVENGIDFSSVLDPSYTDFYETASLTSISSSLDPGQGISLEASKANSDHCDGSLDSWCGRGKDDTCLLYGHNDGRNGLGLDSYSGWLILTLPKVKQGYIVIKYESWHLENSVTRTEGWETINNKRSLVEADQDNSYKDYNMEEIDLTIKEMDSIGSVRQMDPVIVQSHTDRELKAKIQPFCDEFRFEYAIDGMVTSLSLTEWKDERKGNYEVERVVELFTILEDPNYTGGKEKDVEVGVRIVGCGRSKVFSVSHIYWA